jgi:hypothetical protein
LSQRHNIYFVAANDKILIHQPEYPDQKFSSTPKLTLRLPISSPNLRPGIDYDNPHSITRILVGFLGDDEVLLATCDDGDVLGYRVEELQRCLDALEDSSDEDDSDFEVRVFLHMNVGSSAWGLAIHREARMIAISANTHKITVLAYALASAGDQSPESDFSECYSEDNISPDFPAPRKREHVITLRAGHNVPSVSFNNNNEDPTGRWLFSTCITGEIELWDLHNPTKQPARKFEMGWCADPSQAPRSRLGRCSCLNADSHPHGAWGAMFLDPRSAHEVPPSSFDEIESTGRKPPYLEEMGWQKKKFREKSSVQARRAPAESDELASASSEMMVLESDSDMEDVGDEMICIDDDQESAHSRETDLDADSIEEEGTIEQDNENDMDEDTEPANPSVQQNSPPLVSPVLNTQSPEIGWAIDPSDPDMPESLQELADYADLFQQPFSYVFPGPSVYDTHDRYAHRHISKPYCQIEPNESFQEHSVHPTSLLNPHRNE